MSRMKTIYKSILLGTVSSLALLVLYFAIMSISRSSLSEAFSQLYYLRFWVVTLVLTFGIQVGMYVYIRDCNNKHIIGGKSTAVSTATSGTAMLACCAHHLSDILPFIGLSLVAGFLSKYQSWFFGLGIVSNLAGIGMLMRKLRK